MNVVKKPKLSFKDRMKSHNFPDSVMCEHNLIMKYSEVLSRDAEYCTACKNFIW